MQRAANELVVHTDLADLVFDDHDAKALFPGAFHQVGRQLQQGAGLSRAEKSAQKQDLQGGSPPIHIKIYYSRPDVNCNRPCGRGSAKGKRRAAEGYAYYAAGECNFINCGLVGGYAAYGFNYYGRAQSIGQFG